MPSPSVTRRDLPRTGAAGAALIAIAARLAFASRTPTTSGCQIAPRQGG